MLVTALSSALGIAVVAGPAADAAKPTAPKEEANFLLITRALETRIFTGGLPTKAPPTDAAGFAQAGAALTVQVQSRYDADGDLGTTGDNKELAVTKDTAITLKVGTTSVTGTMQRLSSTVDIVFPALDAGNYLLTASAPSRSGITGDDIPLAIATKSSYSPGNSSGARAFGLDGGCELSSANPTCVTLTLDEDVTNQVLVSTSPCAGFAGDLRCPTKGSVKGLIAQTYVDVPAGAIATAVLACDKSLCGGGGVTSFRPFVDKDNLGTFTLAPDCPEKGVIGDTEGGVCVDFRQSTRDNAGDLFTYILFNADLRFSH